MDQLRLTFQTQEKVQGLLIQRLSLCSWNIFYMYCFICCFCLFTLDLQSSLNKVYFYAKFLLRVHVIRDLPHWQSVCLHEDLRIEHFQELWAVFIVVLIVHKSSKNYLNVHKWLFYLVNENKSLCFPGTRRTSRQQYTKNQICFNVFLHLGKQDIPFVVLSDTASQYMEWIR